MEIYYAGSGSNSKTGNRKGSLVMAAEYIPARGDAIK
jgi:hypothetical protein